MMLLSHAIYLIPGAKYDTESGGSISDIPQDVHVVWNSGRVRNLLVPIICVAEEANIVTLITSILCQRHILHISEPVIGLAVIPRSCRVKVVIGWLNTGDEDSRDTVSSA